MGLDWDMPPYGPVEQGATSGPVTLELDCGPFSKEELARSILPRDASAKATLIDLSHYYNVPLTESWHWGRGSSDLSELPQGIQTFAGVQFDVRGLIQVGARSLTGESYPAQVGGIPVECLCKRLHFLHAAIFAGGLPDGTQNGRYVLHYANRPQS